MDHCISWTMALTMVYSIHMYLMGPGLLSSNGATHRRQRKLLNPAFSHAHMRRIAPLMQGISIQLRDLIVNEIASSSSEKTREVDLGEWLGRAALCVLP